MTQDHIKLRWLIEYLDGIDFLKQYHWEATVSEDESESCIVEGELYEVDITYNIDFYIKEYTRSSVELRRILLAWLNAANPQPHQIITTHYKAIDTQRTDVLMSVEVSETQQDIECEASEAEGFINRDGKSIPIKLNRHKPGDLVDLECICKDGIPCQPR